MKFDIAISSFMEDCFGRNLSSKTMASYEQTLKLFSKFLQDEYSLEDANKVKAQHLLDYINHLQERGKYTYYTSNPNFQERRKDSGREISASTINNYIRNIKVFYAWLYEGQGHPLSQVKLLKSKRKAKNYLDDEDFTRLLKTIDKSKYSEYRDYIIIQLILDTGMRINECLLITLDNLSLKDRAILLPASDTKSHKDRYVFFGLTMAKELWINTL